MLGTLLRRNAALVVVAVGLAAGLAARFLVSHASSDWILLATLVAGGAPLVFRTARGVVRGRFAADIVAALAIVAAVVLHQYFAGVVIVLMQTGGEALEEYAMARASESLDLLLARAPRIAHRIDPRGQIEDVPVDDIRVGDSLLLRPGDLVPVDATVTEGRSSVDQSALTGEPFPVPAHPGTQVMSGSLNREGALTVHADRVSAESQYQQIVQLVKIARAERPPIQRLADRWAVWFTPLTLAMCGLAYAVTGDPNTVLAVLVVATPCPLILAVPVAVIAAISRAADAGVIVKTGSAIEQLGLADVVVFDKTGTLTLGQPTVARVTGLNGADSDQVLRLAASVEQFSSHHMGQAVMAEGRRRFGELPRPTDFQETSGAGVVGTVDAHRVMVGSVGYLTSAGIPVVVEEAERPVAYVAIDRQVKGAIEFGDRLRHQVPALMQRLVGLGIVETVMLTGDGHPAAEAIAAQATIRTVLADLLPSDKVAAIKELRRRHRGVIMVGDGTNDAPALAASTVGIAMGAHGPAAAAEAADVVLLVDDVSRVADAIVISRRMRRIATQSVAAGLGISLILMVIASFGFITPAAGALMQEALDAGVILNALRVRRGGSSGR